MAMQDAAPPDYLTPHEFAHRTGLSLATVRRRINDGTLPVFQPGGKRTAVRIPQSALLPTPGSTEWVNKTLSTSPTSPAKALHRQPNWMRHS